MICAAGTNGLRSGQNGLRDLPKWFAQLAKWFAPHFENNRRPWENDLRVDLRLVCALICARGPEVPVAQRKPFSSDSQSKVYEVLQPFLWEGGRQIGAPICCEKMGTGTGKVARFPWFCMAWPEPVPIFSQAMAGGLGRLAQTGHDLAGGLGRRLHTYLTTP